MLSGADPGFQVGGGGGGGGGGRRTKFVGVFRVKNHDLRQKTYFFQF